MSYCDVSDVLEIIPNRNIDDNSTIINLTDVKNLITHAENVINLHLKTAGLENSISDYSEELKTIEAMLTAGLIEARLKADDTGEEGDVPNNSLYKEGMTLLKMIRADDILNPIADPEDTIEGISGESDGLEALFTKNTRQW